MWIVGIIGMYLIYRVLFRWYMPEVIKMGFRSGLVPGILLIKGFHYLVYGSAALVFALSTYCFYLSRHWMVVLSPILLLIALLVDAMKKDKRRRSVIELAANTQVSMGSKGVSQAAINDAICLSILGPGTDLGKDWDLKSLLKTYILPSLGLFVTAGSRVCAGGFDFKSLEQSTKEGTEIDVMVDEALRAVHHPQCLGKTD